MKITISSFPAMVAIKPDFRYAFFFLFIFYVGTAHAQDNLLKRKITIHAKDAQLEKVLLEISDLAQFTFSYDASILSSNKSISYVSENSSVRSTLEEILPENIDYKVSGNHLILLKRSPVPHSSKKEKYIISGHVYDARDSHPLQNIVVYEVSSLASAITDEQGAFSILIPAQFEHLGLSFNHRAFADTIIFVAPKDQVITVSLKAAHMVQPVKKIKRLPINLGTPIESLSLVQQLVSPQMMTRTQNMNLVRQRTAQISFLPTIGTNLKMSGLIENNFSLNILIGYAYGLNVFELGGLFNIIRKEVSGVQIAGLGNMVGKNTHGVQIAGLFNHNRGALFGVQLSGINNMLVDTLRGVQISGINNMLKGGMKGLQLAGINNYTTRNVDGAQIAGLANLTAANVQTLQLAGLFNQAKNVTGVQIAGLVNFVEEDATGFQFAGIANIAKERVSGIQFSGILNYAKQINGRQIGLLNLADSASGTPIGLLSVVRKGFRAAAVFSTEIMPANIALKTGVKRFYNIFTAGIGNWKGKNRWSFGYGFGTEKPLSKKLLLSFEYTANWVSENSTLQKDLSLLNRLDINFIYGKAGKVTFSAGPSLNLWLSEWRDIETGEYLTRLAPYTLVDTQLGTTLAQMWIGGKVAIVW